MDHSDFQNLCGKEPKKITFEARFPVSLLRFALMISPAALNNLSDSTDVPTITNYFIATSYKFG